MRTLLEKAIVHLLNGDDEKAAAMFHKFMVERARQIHESLRQDEGTDDNLNENWDSEIKEEEYFDDHELGDDDPEAADPSMAGDSPIDGDMGGDEVADGGMGDEVADDGMGDDGLDDPAMGGDSEPGLEGKIDDLTDKIDELTAEFDRVMAEFHDDGDDAVPAGDDETLGLDGDAPSDDGDFGSDEPAMGGDSDDLADRMEDDMTDDEHHDPIPETMAPTKTKEKGKIKGVSEDDEGGDEIDESDDLADITESILDELEKITPIKPKEHQGIGSNSQVYKGGITDSGKDSPLPHHNVMDRIKGEPVFTKGPTHKGYDREEGPKVDEPQKLEKNVRLGNRRKHWSDTMKEIPPKGDPSALLHKDFAAGMPAATQSVIDGKSKKG